MPTTSSALLPKQNRGSRLGGAIASSRVRAQKQLSVTWNCASISADHIVLNKLRTNCRFGPDQEVFNRHARNCDRFASTFWSSYSSPRAKSPWFSTLISRYFHVSTIFPRYFSPPGIAGNCARTIRTIRKRGFKDLLRSTFRDAIVNVGCPYRGGLGTQFRKF